MSQLVSHTKKFALGLALGSTLSFGGCSSLPKENANADSSWSLTKMWKKEYQVPQSLAVIWSPDVLTMPGKAPTRGFGGRVFFYNERSQAIPVDGDIVVHGYNGEIGDRVPTLNTEADKTFAFTAEQLTSHFSPSQLGASYSIWIPWDAAGGLKQSVTLIPTFKTKDGAMVQGAAAKVQLPGTSLEDNHDVLPTPAQTVSYRRSSTPTNPGVNLPTAERAKATMRTTTIDVPTGASLTRANNARQTFQLGAGRSSSTVEPQSPTSGVSVGAGQASPTIVVPKKLPSQVHDDVVDRLQNLQLEDLPASRVQSLPKPGSSEERRRTLQTKVELPNISSMVRQASFEFKQNNLNKPSASTPTPTK